MCQGQYAQMGSKYSLKEQFKHAAGIGVILYDFDNSQDLIPIITYSPNLSLTRAFSDMSVSFGSHISFGYHPASSTDSLEYIYTDLPLLVELNLGHNASKDFYSDLGFFIGGGYSFNLFREEWQSGPCATLGIRTYIFGPSFTIRYLRFFAVDEYDQSTHNISLSLNLGNYFESVKKNNKISRFK